MNVSHILNWVIQNISNIKMVLFHILSWFTAGVFLVLGISNINISTPDKIHFIFYVFIIAGLFFLFLPFLKKIKIGTLELEREIEETKKEIKEFKSELRQQIMTLSTNINTIGNLSNHININLPAVQDIKDEIKNITQNSGDNKKAVEKIKEELILPGEDNIMALAKIRIKLEYLLRKKLEKRLSGDITNKVTKFYSINQLAQEWVNDYPKYGYLKRSFDYVIQVCNAAIHAQQISERQIEEALQLGANLIAALNEITN